MSAEKMVGKVRQNISDDSSGNRVKILLSDDHRILRTGLRVLLESQPGFEVVAEAEHGRAALRLSKKLSPDVAIMDITMPDLNGIEATRKILDASPKTKIIMLSVHTEQHFVAEVLKAGASGYVLKHCSFDEILAAIRAVLAGETYLCPQIASVVRDDYLRRLLQETSSSSSLTPREREVIQLIAEGKTTKEIAFALNLSIKTVEAHRQRIMEKLDIHSIADLTKYAIREGITTIELGSRHNNPNTTS
jgi:DNA-binding NarL/FixJ family response regulator